MILIYISIWNTGYVVDISANGPGFRIFLLHKIDKISFLAILDFGLWTYIHLNMWIWIWYYFQKKVDMTHSCEIFFGSILGGKFFFSSHLDKIHVNVPLPTVNHFIILVFTANKTFLLDIQEYRSCVFSCGISGCNGATGSVDLSTKTKLIVGLLPALAVYISGLFNFNRWS